MKRLLIAPALAFALLLPGCTKQNAAPSAQETEKFFGRPPTAEELRQAQSSGKARRSPNAADAASAKAREDAIRAGSSQPGTTR